MGGGGEYKATLLNHQAFFGIFDELSKSYI